MFSPQKPDFNRKKRFTTDWFSNNVPTISLFCLHFQSKSQKNRLTNNEDWHLQLATTRGVAFGDIFSFEELKHIFEQKW